MSSKNTQLSMIANFDVDNIIFSKPEENVIPNSTPQIKYQRINVSVRNPDGTIGDLILPTDSLYSFGLSENVDANTGKSNGLSMALCMWSKDNPKESEKMWTTVFDKIMEKCKDHVLDVKDDIGKYDLERNDLKKFNPLYWKREKGKIVEGAGPMLYTKIIHSKKLEKYLTSFYNEENDEPIDPMDLIGKSCYATCAIKLESIYIGNKISPQIKLMEANIKTLDSNKKRLLGRSNVSVPVPISMPLSTPTPSSSPATNSEVKPSFKDAIQNSDSEGSDDEDDAPKKMLPPATTAKKPIPGKKK